MRNPNWRNDEDRDERRNDPYATGREWNAGRRHGGEYETGNFQEEGASRPARNMPSQSGPYPYRDPNYAGSPSGNEGSFGPRGSWRGDYGPSSYGPGGNYGSVGEGRYADPKSGDRSRTHWNPGAFQGQTPNYGTEPGEFTGKGPKGYRRSDERIREDVCDCLTEHGRIDASDVEVSVSGGEVSLSGTVSDRRQKREIEDLCDRCPGVRDVHNSLRVENETRRGTSSSAYGQESSSASPSGSAGSPAAKNRITENAKH